MPAISVKKLQCACGSTFFFTVRAEQFAAGGYGTAEFRSMSQAPKTFLVCLCGKPTFPQPTSYAQGSSANLAEKDFQESAKAALEAIGNNSLAHYAQIAASPAEVVELREKVDELKNTVALLGTKEYAVEIKAATKRPRAKSSDVREVSTPNGSKV